ncbi:hypothetical protein MMC25_003772 [Agyrium rufum]|nr:hypothetical protein [Agyrium rufum]
MEESASSVRPLQGVILCCTSIPPEERSRLAAIAGQMGATSNLDLTSDVTHLIVGYTDTPKYKYVAKERPDVKCLLPSWVEAVCEVWKRGGQTNVEEIEEQHRVPTFYGLKICVTGFTDLVFRKQLEAAIIENQGEYRADLTKDVTHLVALRPEGEKYKAGKDWGLKVVSIEWFKESLERGMILEETLYDLSLDPAQRGRGAWVRRSSSHASLTKRKREDVVAEAPVRKLRRTASARFGSQSESIWNDVSKTDSLGRTKVEDAWDEVSSVSKPTREDLTKLRSKTIPHQTGQSSDQTPSDSPALMNLPITNPDSLFYDKSFVIHGFTERQTSILEGHLRSHGAHVLSTLFQLKEPRGSRGSAESYLVVPYSSTESDLPPGFDRSRGPAVVTDLWIERCLYQNEYVPYEANITSTLFSHPITGFEDYVLCSTGFEGIDLRHLSKAIKLIGATYDEYLTPGTKALICRDSLPTREKTRHAWEWDIPAVKPDWLWACIQANSIVPIHPRYRILAPNSSASKNVHSKPTLKDTFGTETRSPPPTPKGENRSLTNAEDCDSLGETNPAMPENVDGKNDRSQGNQEEKAVDKVNVVQRSKQVEQLDAGGTRDSVSIATKPTKEVDKPQVLDSFAGSIKPLQELSPNSPPKPNPTKSQRGELKSPAKVSLSTALTSLVAQQREHAVSRKEKGPQPALSRPKRRLFGRATSNLSARSAGSVSISRASSVDTLNTDDMGTPIEPLSAPLAGATISRRADSFADILKSFEDQEEVASFQEEGMGTQVIYDDPEAKSWREKIVRKMGGVLNEDSANNVVPEVKASVIDERATRKRTRRSERWKDAPGIEDQDRDCFPAP